MAHLYKSIRIHQIFGANTGVGKTVLSTALAVSSASSGKRVEYLKPVSTGPVGEADDRFVQKYSVVFKTIRTTCLYAFDDAVSPHLAAQRKQLNDGQHTLQDSAIIRSVSTFVDDLARRQNGKTDIYLETAGGVLSPSPSGSMQADCYRPLRFPTILIGDSRLGGISSTISAYESLTIRGYNVDSVLLFRDDFYKNWQYLLDYFADKDIRVSAFPPPPTIRASADQDRSAMLSYFNDIKPEADEVVAHLDERHGTRLRELDAMRGDAMDNVWWPFVQHGLVQEKEIAVIDSAHGDFFHVYSPQKTAATEGDDLMTAQFDGSASWWTQAFGHSHPALALAAARAAGRYGHVLFPQAIHAPALSLTNRLLSATTGKGWASRVFISDNGSTAMEIALKMALRAYCSWFGQDLTKSQRQRLGVLGLKGSYHGDTIGAMDACDAGDGVYTCEWHNAKGYWFDPPTFGFRDGKPIITIPSAMTQAIGLTPYIETESAIWAYDVHARLDTHLYQRYRDYVRASLAKLQEETDMRISALVLEPLVMGAGGMIFVDPLFQRVLVDVVRDQPFHSQNSGSSANHRLPVIFDEVFVGLHRLGQESCSTVLGVHPDIAVYAKMLTGGTVPLAVTLASSPIFEAFYSEKKSDALLHGHSYTAHAVGCEVANESMKLMEKLTSSSGWKEMREKWRISSVKSDQHVWSFFEPHFVDTLSRSRKVEWAMSLGTVLAFKLAGDGGGYNSHAAQTLLSRIRQPIINGSDEPTFGVHMRTLGDSAYFITSLNTPSSTIRTLEKAIIAALSASS